LARLVEVALGQVELSLSQYRILMLLDRHAAVASKLAHHLAVSPPSVTAVVDGLVARGLVERRAQEGDRRRVEHALTGDGRRLLGEADARIDARFGEIASFLEASEAAEAAAGLQRWGEALDAYRSSRLEVKA
jgi:DNA-binding MarR family transcriptional regulator